MRGIRVRHRRLLIRSVLLLALLLSAVGPSVLTNASNIAATSGPVLVVMAHPDDEALGAAGVIEAARAAGRRVYVAIATQGGSGTYGTQNGFCGTTSTAESTAAQYGLLRDRETMAGMGMLGLTWSANPSVSDVFLLGYPDGALTTIANSPAPWTGDVTGLHQTYAEDNTSTTTCNGDLRFVLGGSHSTLSAGSLAADFDSLLSLTNPTDIYTHASFDGHADHREVYRQTVTSAQRRSLTVTVHSTLMHPEGADTCGAFSAAMWPNPVNSDPYARFTPSLDVTAPPVPACSTPTTGSTWGSAGPPNELVTVPADMRTTSEATNRKWQVLSQYASQIGCPSAVSCGYMRAFVKAHEFFWTQQLAPPAPPPPGSNQFGSTRIGALPNQAPKGSKFGSISPLANAGALVDFKFYARGGTAAQSFVPAVYTVDANGAPDTLVAAGATVTVGAGAAASWFTSALPAAPLTAGSYMLAVVSGPADNGAILAYDAVVNGGVYNANPLLAPGNPWGGVNAEDNRYSFYVDYLPNTPPSSTTTVPSSSTTTSAPATTTTAPTSTTTTVPATSGRFGVTAPGTQVDQPSAGYKFGSVFALGSAGSLIDFKFYARGGGSGQSFVPAIYAANAQGVPGALVAQGTAVTVGAGALAGWFTSALPASTLSPGNYLLALLPGPGSGTAVYYDVATNGGIWNANAGSSPSPSWGAVNAENSRWSFYVDYGVGSTTTTTSTTTTSTTTTIPPSTTTTVPGSTTTTVPSTTARFGSTTPGSQIDQPSPGYKLGSIFALSGAGTAIDFKFYGRGGTASQSFVPAVYAVDAQGDPGALIAKGAAVTVVAGAAAGWFTAVLPATALSAGNYMLALLPGPAVGGATINYDSVVNGGIWNANPGTTPSASWGAVNPENSRWSFYVDYRLP